MLTKSNGLPLRVPVLPGTKEFTTCPPHVGRHVVESKFRPPFHLFSLMITLHMRKYFAYYNVYNKYLLRLLIIFISPHDKYRISAENFYDSIQTHKNHESFLPWELYSIIAH